MSKQATAGTSGRIPVTTSSAASDFGWWSGARSVRARMRVHDRGVDPDRAGELRPAVDDPVADGADRAEAADGVGHGQGVGRPARRGQVRRRDDGVVAVEDAAA